MIGLKMLGIILLCLVGMYSTTNLLTVSDQDMNLLTQQTGSFVLSLQQSDPTKQDDVTISFAFQDGNEKLLKPIPSIKMKANSNQTIYVNATSQAGHVDIVTNATGNNTNTNQAFVRVVVMKSKTIDIISTVIGWIYFVAWSVSFYPQMIENFRRKSVIGLNFDFLSLNIVGFTLYGCYNIALFWIDSIQDDYLSRHPRGVIPVQANDVFFPIHAVFACAVTIFQCIIYDRGDQRISRGCLGLLLIIAGVVVVTLILAIVGTIAWLDFLYYCSYIKLGITIIKYMPQAYMNFRRKSTVGWSIGNIILDFTGGSLSILQMILIAHNNDDWSSIFGDPTKFGLGFFSIIFDVFFMLQHYVFYRGNLPHEVLAGSTERLETGVPTDQEPENPDCPRV